MTSPFYTPSSINASQPELGHSCQAEVPQPTFLPTDILTSTSWASTVLDPCKRRGYRTRTHVSTSQGVTLKDLHHRHKTGKRLSQSLVEACKKVGFFTGEEDKNASFGVGQKRPHWNDSRVTARIRTAQGEGGGGHIFRAPMPHVGV